MQTKKAALFAILAAFSIVPAAAQFFLGGKGLGGFHLSVTPTAELSSGVLGEYLYESNKSETLNSLLEWDRNVSMFGAEIGLSYGMISLKTSFALSAGMDGRGEMQDSDWMNDSDKSIKTRYSVGKTANETNIDARAEISLAIPVSPSVKIIPKASFIFMRDEFSRDGKTTEGWYNMSGGWWYDADEENHYPNTYWSDEKGRYVTRRLAGIDFRRDAEIFFAGIAFSADISERISLRYSASLSPLAFFSTLDTHYAKDSSTGTMYGKHYRQKQTSYFSHALFSLGADFRATQSFSVSFDASLLSSLWISHGRTEADYAYGCRQDGYIDLWQDSGESMRVFSAKLGVNFLLF